MSSTNEAITTAITAITQFNRTNAALIHAEAVLLLKPLAEKYGIRIEQAGGQIGGANLVLKFAFKCEGEEAEKLEFEKQRHLFGCSVSDYGRVATINRKECTLIGFDLGRRKFPVRCRHKDGKVMLYTEDVLKRYFHTGDANRVL